MTAPLEPGARLGPYVLQSRLGSGGSADVWEAVLEGPGGFQKPVALKLLKAGLDQDPDQREALLREARLGARLQHPNLVSTLLLSQLGDRLGVALELVRGPTASELMRRLGGPLPPRALLDLALHAAQALAYIHAFPVDGRLAGLVHRDLKPSNLLVDPHGVVKLADLGICVPTGESGGLAGTPGFMAPEQADGRPEPRSDLFSLGVTLYCLATGRMPFGRGLPAIAEARRAESHLRRAEFLAPLDQALPGLGAILRGCLRAAPAERAPSAEAVHQDLRALLPAAPSGPTLGDLVNGEAPTARREDLSQGSAAPTRLVVAGNLKPARDAFVGRRDELLHLASLLDEDPWIVLLGPGGLGKTRLALELARSVQRRFSGGAWAFDLTEARSVDGVCDAVARGLGVPLEAADPVRQLGHAFASKGPCLVLLDNLEQCVQALPESLERWRTLAPEARFLGTSRVRPGLPGERVFPLGELDSDDALRLFLQRAPRPLTDAERPLVPPLCDALDRVPLSLELAAARLRVVPLAEISRRLSLKLLAGGGQDRPERHRSIQASLLWSWELLSAPARQALLQLSVFEGGFDWAAAEAVLDLGPDAPWALDVLQELVDTSLLRVDRASGRFSPWVVVREFAAERLLGEERQATEGRHGRHFSAMDPRSPALGLELDNLVAACRSAAARGDEEVAARSLGLAAEVFSLRGPSGTSVALATEVRSGVRRPVPLARACLLLGSALNQAGRPAEALEALEEALHLHLALDERHRRALPADHEPAIHGALGLALQHLGRVREAREHLELALAARQRAGDRRAESAARNHLGALEREQGRMGEARVQFEAALRLARGAGDRQAEGVALGDLGNLLCEIGDKEQARLCFEQATALCREVGDRRLEGVLLGSLAGLHLDLGRLDDARACYEQALAMHREAGDRRSEGIVLGNLGILHLERGDLDRALGCYEEARAVHRSAGNRRAEGVVLGNLGNLCAARGRFEEAQSRYEEALAIAREVENRATQGYVLANLGHLHRQQGRPAEALACLEPALALAREVGERRLEGGLLGLLGVLHREEGRLDEARSSLDAGERLLLLLGDRLELGKLWCERACLEARAGRPEAAAGELRRAEELARELSVGSDSELARAVERARGALARD